LTRNILATQPRVTRFKIEWDDKPSEAGTSAAAVASMEDNSMEQNADSNSSPPTLVEATGFGNGTNALDYSRCGGENNSLIDPSATMITPGISTSNDSMSAPMEVI